LVTLDTIAEVPASGSSVQWAVVDRLNKFRSGRSSADGAGVSATREK
jgi:hypothetical protein